MKSNGEPIFTGDKIRAVRAVRQKFSQKFSARAARRFRPANPRGRQCAANTVHGVIV